MTAIRPTGAIPDVGFNVVTYGAKGDGVANDTAAIQNAINDASLAYAATGSSTTVRFPSGRVYLSSQLFMQPGVTLWAYGATIQATTTGWPNHGFLTWRPGGVAPPAGSILTDVSVLGGLWRGSGLESQTTNQYWLEFNAVTAGLGVQDCAVRDTTVTGWGWVPLIIQNPTHVDITDNHLYGNDVLSNTLFQNEINIFIDDTAAFGGEFTTSRNKIHNAVADAIGVVVGLGNPGPSNGRIGWICSENICTCDPPRVDTDGVAGATVTVTNASATVIDSACSAADVGKFVTGTGIPQVTYISSFTAGSPNTFTMNKTATSGGTSVSVGVYKSSINLEIDATTVPITDFTIVDNDVVGYERAPIQVSLPNTKSAQRGLIMNNRVVNSQTGTPVAPQGTGIRFSGVSSAIDVAVVNNRITAYTPINVSGSGFTNTGLQSGNKFTIDPMQGRAVLSSGSATVTTTEIRTGDNVILSRVVVGGTIGSLSVGTITDQTSFTITSSSGSDTSTVYWKIEH